MSPTPDFATYWLRRGFEALVNDRVKALWMFVFSWALNAVVAHIENRYFRAAAETAADIMQVSLSPDKKKTVSTKTDVDISKKNQLTEAASSSGAAPTMTPASAADNASALRTQVRGLGHSRCVCH